MLQKVTSSALRDCRHQKYRQALPAALSFQQENQDTEAAGAAAACSNDGSGQQVPGSCQASVDPKTLAKHSRGVSGICIVWRAETSIAKGEELCNNYGLLLQDNTVLQYGFLQVWFSQAQAPGGAGLNAAFVWRFSFQQVRYMP